MLNSLKVYVTELDIGMFVSGLDRPWLDTPFATQGFLLESRTDIDRVRDYCNFVFIDTQKSRQQGTSLERKMRPKRRRVPVENIFPDRTFEPYQDEDEWKEEHPRAVIALDMLVDDITDIFDHVSDGGTLDVLRLKKSVDPIIASISRNPDACLWLTRLKQHDEYSYQHSLSASIWAVALGRQLGLHRRHLRSLAIGGLLMDVGKLRVDPKLLQAERSLTPDEMVQIRHHVSHGVELVHESGIINQDVIDMVAHHHERYDGSGYPQGLSGDQIPPVARIAAIVDTYDAITCKRSYAPALSPSEAIRTLYKARDEKFQAELVEAFIQAVGIYPAGTLVELSSGEVGVVVAEYRTRRLLPKVILVLDANKKALPKPRTLDLLTASSEDEKLPLTIAKSLEPGAYGIDISQFEI
jgi:HD-GYP domain-containing protein (c-di-GMP phosphodiesterase class II)